MITVVDQHCPKSDDEGENSRPRSDSKFPLGQQRQKDTFDANSRPDEGVHGHKQGELLPVCAKA